MSEQRFEIGQWAWSGVSGRNSFEFLTAFGDTRMGIKSPNLALKVWRTHSMSRFVPQSAQLRPFKISPAVN